MTIVEKICNRQFERMKSELQGVKMPNGYMTIISKYWDFAKMDLEQALEQAEDEDEINGNY